MVPFWGRFSLRTARIALAVLGLVWCALAHLQPSAWALAGGYAIFSLVVLLASKFDVQPRSLIALAGDTIFFCLCEWLLFADPYLALATAYILLAAALLHPFRRLLMVAGAAALSTCLAAMFR